MRIASTAVLLTVAVLLASPALSQPWEGYYQPTDERRADFQVLVLDPSGGPGAGRYHFLSLADLLRGVVEFPDTSRRYIALSEHDPLTPASFAATDFTRSVEGVLTGIKIPAPLPDSFPVVWIGMAIPVDRSPPPYFSIGPLPGINAVGSIQQQSGTVTIDGEVYAVWIALTTAAHAVADYVFFDSAAVVEGGAQ